MVMGFTLELRFKFISPQRFEKMFIKLHTNVSLSETMCRIYDSGSMTSLKVMVILK